MLINTKNLFFVVPDWMLKQNNYMFDFPEEAYTTEEDAREEQKKMSWLDTTVISFKDLFEKISRDIHNDA